MTSKIVVIVIFLSIAISSGAQDVRKLSWGMTKEKVKSLEGTQLFKTGKTPEGFDFLYYDGTIAGLKCTLAFYFIQGKLFQVRYLFTESHSEKNLYRDDFLNTCLTLDGKFGVAKVEHIWTNDLYKDNYDDFGKAIAAGHLTMYTFRDLERTEITHTVSGDNFDISHGISFKSKELDKEVKEQIKKKNESDF